MPAHRAFRTEIPVRITDINYGNHLGNDAMLSIIHEARLQFLNHFGYSEANVEGTGVIMADVVIVYKSQAFYGDRLAIEIGIDDVARKSCDIYYQITKGDGTLVAIAKTNLAFFDYTAQKTVAIPGKFLEKTGVSPA